MHRGYEWLEIVTASDTNGHEAAETIHHAGGEAAADPGLFWLLHEKMAVPERVADHLERSALVDRALPTRRRLTVLKAPGGFGKTTLLGECCRRLREEGVHTAWVSLDEQDEPAVVDTYVAVACMSAGLKMPDAPDPNDGRGEPESRIEHVLRAIQALGGPFVLVFDEVERLKNPASVALLDFLLRRGPVNLHLAFVCRELPAGLNVAGAVIDDRAEILTADDLRFSNSEAAAFFDEGLSKRELARVMAESVGWPFALRIARNRMAQGAGEDARTERDLIENWVDSRLFEGLEADEREFLLDLGLFDTVDASLIDEVLERSDCARRIDAMPVLVGLLAPIHGGAAARWQLHPLVRDHCVRQRYRRTPERYRSIHRRIACALARRDETASGMRHAIEAGDTAFAGDILERAGGAFVWFQQGTVPFQAAARWLSDEVVAGRPRLALARCLDLILSGNMKAARERYRALDATLRAGIAAGGDAGLALEMDQCIVRGCITLYSGEGIGSQWTQTLVADLARHATSPQFDPLVGGNIEYGLCLWHHLTAEFEEALERAERARQCFGKSRYMSLYVDIQVGQNAMALGRVDEAEAHYRRALREARKAFVVDTVPATIANVLLQELVVECNRPAAGAALDGVPRVLMTNGTPFSAYAAAAGVAIDLRLRDEGVDAALGVAEEMLVFVRSAGLAPLVRYLAALRVSLLTVGGWVGEAERAWRSDGLPEEFGGCLDVAGQSWREMEALSCARLRLLIADERFDEGRCFAGDLCAAAASRGLRRTLMRALALSIVLERRAGALAVADGHLEEFLRLFAATPYARPLVRERDDCTGVVAALVALAAKSPHGAAAKRLLKAMSSDDDAGQLLLSARESEVLQRLGRQRDKQIAAELGLTANGVRYHIRSLFTKFGAGSRAEVVRKAREAGLIVDGI